MLGFELIHDMKKTAAIFHGLGGSEKSFWIPWLKNALAENEFDVWAPSLPECDGFNDLDQWVDVVSAKSPYRAYDLMVGHSAGGSLILRLLSNADFSANHAISVAGFIKPLPDNQVRDLAFPAGFDVKSIKDNCCALTFFHSDNDPWGCGQEQGELMRRSLGGTLVIISGEGHFGSDYMKQSYDSFPLLLGHCLL